MGESIRREILVQAAPERAFAAFTEVPELLAWLADGAVVGRRVGGNWALGWYADEESDDGYHVFGTFAVFEPSSRLVVHDVRFSSPEGETFEGMTLDVGFEPSDGGTRVTVSQEGIGSGPAWDAYAAGLGAGWERSLADLRAWLDEGRKLPGR